MQPSWSNIKSRGRNSTQTGAPFNVGERVVSFLYKAESGELDRADVMEAESAAFIAPGEVLGRWVRNFKDTGQADKAQAVATAESAEGLFWSLIEGESEVPEVAVLKQLLALWLERKRVLRPQGSRGKKGQQYLHPATGREVWVDWVEPSPELAGVVERALGTWILK